MLACPGPAVYIYFSRAAYCSSSTGSSHSFEVSSPGTSTARWANQLSLAAPCQCLTLAGDVHDVARVELARGPAPLLIPAASAGDEEYLPAAAAGVVYMPVVAAAGLKGYVADADLLRAEHVQVALAYEYCAKALFSFPRGNTVVNSSLIVTAPFICSVVCIPGLQGFLLMERSS